MIMKTTKTTTMALLPKRAQPPSVSSDGGRNTITATWSDLWWYGLSTLSMAAVRETFKFSDANSLDTIPLIWRPFVLRGMSAWQ